MPRLTPLEIQKHEFSRKWKGFDPVEVESFVALVAEEMEEIIRANAELSGRVERREEDSRRQRIHSDGSDGRGAFNRFRDGRAFCGVQRGQSLGGAFEKPAQ